MSNQHFVDGIEMWGRTIKVSCEQKVKRFGFQEGLSCPHESVTMKALLSASLKAVPSDPELECDSPILPALVPWPHQP